MATLRRSIRPTAFPLDIAHRVAEHVNDCGLASHRTAYKHETVSDHDGVVELQYFLFEFRFR